MKKSKLILFVLPILILFLIGIANAQTLVAGKIYNADFSGNLKDVNVSVECNGHVLNTKSLEDGTYAVRFEEDLCAEGDTANVSASKAGYITKINFGILSICENADCGGNYLAVVNLGLEIAPSEPTTSGNNHGSSSGNSKTNGKFYLCGNNKCDTGETTNTCPKDCPAIENLNSGLEEELKNLEDSETQENQTGFSRITGAVIGAVGKTSAWIIVIFIFIITASAVSIRIARKKKRN